MTTKTRTFTDLDLAFSAHPVTGDITVKTDENAIKTAIKNLVMTRFGERLFHSEIGSNANNMLFELPGPSLVALMNIEIRDVITNFEPRAEVLDVHTIFNPDNNWVGITCVFKILNIETPINLQITLKRTR